MLQRSPASLTDSQKVNKNVEGKSHSEMIDRTAIGFSLLCLAHCLAIPLLATIAPLLLPHNQDVHWILLIIALPLTSFGLWRGVSIHGDYRILALGLVGLLAMAVGAGEPFGEPAATYTTILGVSLIFVAHALNLWRQR